VAAEVVIPLYQPDQSSGTQQWGCPPKLDSGAGGASKINYKNKINLNGDGQECPSHNNSPNPFDG